MIALILYTNSIKITPLSLSLPILAFTPGIILITSIFINHELPSIVGILGLILIIIGSYLLNFDYLDKDLLFPFKQLVKNKGILMMFGVTVIWGFNNSIHRFAISLSNPWFYTSFGALILAIIFTPIAYLSSPKEFKSIFKRKSLLILMPIGILDGAMV
ncbi:MAG: EamA family transporter [bacterium]|nr:EamA family transporter [bacterium]